MTAPAARSRRPSLILVGGAPASGKTSGGIVHADGGKTPAWGAPIATRSFGIFFETLRQMLTNGVTVVAEAAYRRGLSERDLLPLVELAETRLVLCEVADETARNRFAERAATDRVRRLSHPDHEVLKAIDRGELRLDDFGRLELPIPTLTVDTTNGYDPSLEQIVEFINDH